MTALEAVPARLARDGERVLCGRARPGAPPCLPELATYFGREGGDPLAWAVELAPMYRLERGESREVFGVRKGTGHGRVRERANSGRELLAQPVPFESNPQSVASVRILFSKVSQVLVRCSHCEAVNLITGGDLARQYGALVERGRLTASR